MDKVEKRTESLDSQDAQISCRDDNLDKNVDLDKSVAENAAQESADQIAVGEIETIIETKLIKDGKVQDYGIVSILAADIASEVVRELSSKDSDFFRELSRIAQSIDIAKTEVASIRPKELTEKELPDAQNALEIIISSSEEAAGEILSCGEELMGIAEFVPGKLADRLNEISTRLFEASNFDDLNGQRIKKVISTISGIEQRLKALLEKYGEQYETVSTKEEAAEQNDPLLNGPQEKEKATSQEEIDRILADF